jgi:cytochrome c oxidase subunit I
VSVASAAGGFAADADAQPVPVPIERVKGLVMRYVLTSTAIFLIGGALGAVLRQSQAEVRTVSAGLWYELMTAHGLAAFVGWAAFALMGLSWWVLSEIGFPLAGWSWRWAVACWWTMVLGVTGIVITTLALGFAGSWVFLYPLPLESQGAWSDLAAAIFSASVLVVGLSIFAYCFGILALVTGPGLTASSSSPWNRLGCALGFGYLSPTRFATERTLPYPVIPFTVIAINMIVATIPLAVLLIEMIVQAVDPSVTIDPLLAKSMLWWFGHPVVYLLLFPAVALYYHLIPRYAQRPLVAGKAIAIAWLIGVVSNMFIGAHHMYTDFPDTFQQSVNTAMQPLTYAVTIPSALSLFSLAFTIYRSDFIWTPASRFLCVALVSWLVAGLQGVGLATIQYDAVAHNTLWVVGHFHNMALLNIGLVIFGGVYAFLPSLIGREWHSQRLGNWHLGLTVVGGYGSVVPWMIQGLDGAPRRWAVLPDRYLELTQLALPFVALIMIGQLIFVYNLARTLSGEPMTVWLGGRRDVQVDEQPVAGRLPERPTETLGALLAGLGVAVSVYAFWFKPFLWVPIGVMLGYTAIAVGSRRQGMWTIIVSLLILVLAILLRL